MSTPLFCTRHLSHPLFFNVIKKILFGTKVLTTGNRMVYSYIVQYKQPICFYCSSTFSSQLRVFFIQPYYMSNLRLCQYKNTIYWLYIYRIYNIYWFLKKILLIISICVDYYLFTFIHIINKINISRLLHNIVEMQKIYTNFKNLSYILYCLKLYFVQLLNIFVQYD